MIDVFARFPISPEPTSGCWLWVGVLNAGGYGSFTYEKRTRNAHRLIYELLVGEIPAGMDLDHRCRVRCCVNPAHLEPVTRQENILRGVGPMLLRERNRAVTHCPAGHRHSPENTYLSRAGKRDCKECRRRRVREWRGRRSIITAASQRS